MTNYIQRLFNKTSAFFVSGRTHFKFVRRCGQWLIRFCQPIANIFTRFSTLFPFWGNFISLLDNGFDMLGFGTNKANGPIAQTFSFVGYGLITALSLLGMIVGTTAHLPFITSLSLLLGMYFEAVTLLNWFDNYKTFERAKQSGQLDDPDKLENARIMVNAAVITFASIVFKGISISIGIIFPTAGLTLFITAQTAELAAMIGSIGKETVNIKQNSSDLAKTIELSESEWLKGSFGKIFKATPIIENEKNVVKQPTVTPELSADQANSNELKLAPIPTTFQSARF